MVFQCNYEQHKFFSCLLHFSIYPTMITHVLAHVLNEEIEKMGKMQSTR